MYRHSVQNQYIENETKKQLVSDFGHRTEREADMDFFGFYTGTEFEAYRFLGHHFTDDGVIFRVYAPAAQKVALIGQFNDWKEQEMNRVHDGQFFECVNKDAKNGDLYKYRIYRKDGTFIDHCDPYAFFSELRPGTASAVFDMSQYKFHDKKWLSKRSTMKDQPLNIYELHFGSWKKNGEDWYRYDELGDLLIPYVKEQGYNYIEIMPLNEYPSDESWGYQATGFYSATSRYGTPDQLRFFIDQCHKNNIGVILDIVTVHFAVNDYALWNFDGTSLYEYPNSAVGYSEWGSCNFMHSRGDVCSFLQSASYFWLQEYHFDGLRMDAVGNLIYWQGNKDRGENKGAIQFLKNMNAGLKQRMPECILAAEDSTAYPNVCRPASEGGLGFDYKWDMGWMNDTLDFFRKEPKYRKDAYHKLTFSMAYFYNENYLLPLSHDEVVHGKATILQKMGSVYEGKFPLGRALYLYMFTHPGKKLNFMGNEFGQLREWDEKREQDWDMLKYPLHDSFNAFIKKLNHIYLEHPALYKHDYDRTGFEWKEADLVNDCIYAYWRKSEEEKLFVILNLSDKKRKYTLGNLKGKCLELLIDSDDQTFSGSSKPFPLLNPDDRGAVFMDLPPASGRIYLLKDQKKTKKEKAEE